MTKEEKPKNLMAVKAIATGFYGGARRRPGEVFFVPYGLVGKWFVPTDPTLLDKHNHALEEKRKADKKAADEHKAARLKADEDAKKAKVEADRKLVRDKRNADEIAAKALGGLHPKNQPQTAPVVVNATIDQKPVIEGAPVEDTPETKPEGEGAPAPEAGAVNTEGLA